MATRKNASALWCHFEKDANSGKAVCNVCKDYLSYKSTTANLKSHLKRKHISIFSSLCEEEDPFQPQPHKIQLMTNIANSTQHAIPRASTASTSQLTNINVPPPSKRQKIMDAYVNNKISSDQKKQIDLDLLDLCIDGFHPFSIVEERSFRKYSRWIPGYKLPTRKTLENSLLQEVYNKTVNTIEEQITREVDTICITTDLWSSRITESYIAVTGHYLNESVEFKTVLLGCCNFSGNPTASNIATEVGVIIDRWNLKGKINFAVSDNATNMVKAIKEGLGWEHFGCYAHTLNLIVGDSLKICHEEVEKVKKIVRYFKKSTPSSERPTKYQIQKNCQSKRLVQDVETRWDSTYYMLNSIVELEEAVRSTLALININHKKDLPVISNDDWLIYRQLTQVLKPFEIMTTTMSGQNYLTGSSVIVMTRCLEESCNKMAEDTNLSSLVTQVVSSLKLGLRERFKNIEQNETLAICTFLDPRFKMQAFSNLNEASKTKQKVAELVASRIIKSCSVTVVESLKPEEIKVGNESSPWKIFDNMIRQNTSDDTPLSKAIKEVDMYLADDFLPRINITGDWNSPLEWWRNHRHVYPNLTKLYINKCNIVATSVPCERMFSKSGLIISERRTRLRTSKVEKLMFLNVNLSNQRFANL